MLVVYALVLGSIHIFASQFRFLSVVPRSKWLSAAGGVAVAYVFVHIFPELREMQRIVSEHLKESALGFLDTHVYLIALLGLVVFYGLERMARTSRHAQKETRGEDKTSPEIFWIHVSSFAVYNTLVGYLLVSASRGAVGAFLYFFAMGVHFLTNDYGLWFDYKDRYTRVGRWLLSGAVVFGALLGFYWKLPEIWIAVLFSFLAGGVVMNVLKEELPEERKSSFWAFAGGTAAYAILLLWI